jgi:hypothetical protein
MSDLARRVLAAVEVAFSVPDKPNSGKAGVAGLQR